MSQGGKYILHHLKTNKYV